MKASIKLALTQKPNEEGFPIYKILRCAGQAPKKETIFRTFPEHWNNSTKEITPQHPNYDNLIADLLNLKSIIADINTKSKTYSYDEAKELLFGVGEFKSDGFYDAGLSFVTNTTNGKLYRTVLNSFNAAFPGVNYVDITKADVTAYMRALLKKGQKPNGVHTYLRTLDAIFKLVCDLDSPFKGVRPKLESTPQKDLSIEDLKKIFYTRTIKHKFDGKNTNFTVNKYRYYYMLLFLLGGIDMVDLYNLRYDKHVYGNRLQFTRFKGGTNAFINNRIYPEAWEILKRFDCQPYLVPIHTYPVLNNFVGNMDERFIKQVKGLDLTRRPLTKSARYSFINIAQDLGIDERIVGQIIGHKIRRTTSIYAKEFPQKVTDKVHRNIINAVIIK